MLEQEYLELVNQLKEQFDEKENEVKSIKEENENLKKIFISAYGFIRIIDNMATDTDIDFEVKSMIDVLRGYLSNEYDDLF
tara:strand:- start:752 stop:994 length:243 start_codon:yes stop_codon:yes gene_type:complete